MILVRFSTLFWRQLIETESLKSLAGSRVWTIGSDRSGFRKLQGLAYLASSPVDPKLTPARGLPEARVSRTPARLGPTWSIAAERLRKAWPRGRAFGKAKDPGDIG